MTIELFIIVLVFGFGFFYLGSPLVFSREAKPAGKPDLGELRDLHLRKEELLSSIKDLELDHRTSKISESDYQELYHEALGEGVGLLESIDKAEKEKKERSPEAKASLTKAKQSRFCPQCGEALLSKAKFCAFCGTPSPGKEVLK